MHATLVPMINTILMGLDALHVILPVKHAMVLSPPTAYHAIQAIPPLLDHAR